MGPPPQLFFAAWIVVYIPLECFVSVPSRSERDYNCVADFPLVFVRLALTSGSAQLEDSRIHLIKACLSAVLASFGKPSTVKDGTLA